MDIEKMSENGERIIHLHPEMQIDAIELKALRDAEKENACAGIFKSYCIGVFTGYAVHGIENNLAGNEYLPETTQSAERTDNVFDEIEYNTRKSYAELMGEIKMMLNEIDDTSYDDIDTLHNVIFIAYKSVKNEYRSYRGEL